MRWGTGEDLCALRKRHLNRALKGEEIEAGMILVSCEQRPIAAEWPEAGVYSIAIGHRVSRRTIS